MKDSAGKPIAGVLVHVLTKGKGGDADIREHSHKTDAEGRWQCNEVPADPSKTWFRLEHPDFARLTPDSFQPTVKDLEKERYRRTITELINTEISLSKPRRPLRCWNRRFRQAKRQTGTRTSSR